MLCMWDTSSVSKMSNVFFVIFIKFEWLKIKDCLQNNVYSMGKFQFELSECSKMGKHWTTIGFVYFLKSTLFPTNQLIRKRASENYSLLPLKARTNNAFLGKMKNIYKC